MFLPSSFFCLSSFSCGRDRRPSFSSSSWDQSLMEFLRCQKKKLVSALKTCYIPLFLCTRVVYVVPCGNGSCGRWCLCLCLLFFFGGCMCISLYCSGSWKKNTKTCIRVSIKLNNIIKKWTMLVSSGYAVNSLSNQSLHAENVFDFRTCVCVCVLCIQFVPVLCVVWSLWAERRSVGWTSSHTLEAYRSKSATSCRPECPDSRSSLQHRRERTSRN